MNTYKTPRQYTLISPWFDGVFLWSSLPILCMSILFFEIFAPHMIHPGYYPLWFFLLVISVDVSHVYASVFRLLTVEHIPNSYRWKLWSIPIASFVFLLCVAMVAPENNFFLVFQCLTFLALYHFIKQQIGVTLLYGAHDRGGTPSEQKSIRLLDKSLIWIVTGLPMIYWISRGEGVDLEWFVAGEFAFLTPYMGDFNLIAFIALFGVLLYILFQVFLIMTTIYRPNPLKYGYIALTAFVWGVGIIAYESFILFGLGVMLLHGIAYHGLVIASVDKALIRRESVGRSRQILCIVMMVLFIVMLAFFEEGLWDQLAWREHGELFGSALHSIDTSAILPYIIALLGSIQVSHYILDRYIWKREFGSVTQGK